MCIRGQDGLDVPCRLIPAEEVDRELSRFRPALEKSRVELQRLRDRVQSELGPDEAEIFSAHLLFLEDPQFMQRVATRLKGGSLVIRTLDLGGDK